MINIQSIYIITFFALSISCQRHSTNTLKILHQVSSPITHFDPQLATGLAANLQMGKVYENLMQSNPYKPPFGLIPALALDFPTISKNGLNYLFTIKKNIFYHPSKAFKNNQRELIAEDFVNAFKRIADPHLVSPHYSYWKKYIVGLESWHNKNKLLNKTNYDIALTGVMAKQKYQLLIKIKSPDRFFLHLLTGPATTPIPREIIKYYKNDLSKNMIGTGPFILKEYVRKNHLYFVKNPFYREDYFPKDKSLKVPFIDQIKVKIINETQTMWLNFMSGKIDYLEVPKDNISNTLTPQNTLTPLMKKKGIQIGLAPSQTNLYYFGLNNNSPLLNNFKIRKKIAQNIDKQKFNQLFFNNTAEIAFSILPSNIPGNTPPLMPSNVYENISIKQDRPLIILVRNLTVSRQVGEFLQKELSKIGIKSRVETSSWPRFLDRAQNGDYDIFYLAWFVGIPSPFEFFELIYGPNAPDSYNRVGFKNDQFDNLFAMAKKQTQLKLQNQLIRKMNQIFLDKMPLIPLVHAKNFFVHHRWLKNYVPTYLNYGIEKYLDINLKAKAKK